MTPRPAMTLAARAALIVTRELVAAAPKRWPCEEITTISCPRGCGLLTSARAHVYWGPWRMQSHLMHARCPAALPGVTTTRRGRR